MKTIIKSEEALYQAFYHFDQQLRGLNPTMDCTISKELAYMLRNLFDFWQARTKESQAVEVFFYHLFLSNRGIYKRTLDTLELAHKNSLLTELEEDEDDEER